MWSVSVVNDPSVILLLIVETGNCFDNDSVVTAEGRTKVIIIRPASAWIDRLGLGNVK